MGLGSFIKKGVSSLFGNISGQKAGKAIDKSTNQQVQYLNRILDMNRPFVDASVAQLAPMAEDATVSGFGENIGDILNSGSFDMLRQQRQRSATQAFANAGLRRAGAAGRGAADIDTDLAMMIEQELNRRRSGLLGAGQNAMASSAGALGNIGSTLASGTLGKAEAKAGGFENIMKIGGSLLSSIFSDARLKTNAVKIGKIGPLDVWEWDWNDLAEEIGFTGSSTGFMAHEVMKTHPHRVIQAGELLKIDHEGLLEDLRNAYH